MSQLLLNKADDIEMFLDPFRMKIMRILKEKHEPMTVKEIGEKMGEVPAKVYYHVKKLEAIGVLYIKYTRQINGIVAKYYDFTTDHVALSVPEGEGNTDLLRSQIIREYGRSFDAAKQKFYDFFNHGDEKSIEAGDVFIYEKNAFPIDPQKIAALNDELTALIEKYRYTGADAVNYSLFISGIHNFDEEN